MSGEKRQAWEAFTGDHKQSGFVERAFFAGYDAAEAELSRLRAERDEIRRASHQLDDWATLVSQSLIDRDYQRLQEIRKGMPDVVGCWRRGEVAALRAERETLATQIQDARALIGWLQESARGWGATGVVESFSAVLEVLDPRAALSSPTKPNPATNRPIPAAGETGATNLTLPSGAALVQLIEKMPAVVFASDDKEREMLAKSVVLTVIRNALSSFPRQPDTPPTEILVSRNLLYELKAAVIYGMKSKSLANDINKALRTAAEPAFPERTPE